MKVKTPSWLKGLVGNGSQSQGNKGAATEDAWIDSVPSGRSPQKATRSSSLTRLVHPMDSGNTGSLTTRMPSTDKVKNAIDRLLKMCNGRKASPLMRPLADCWLLIADAVEKRQGEVPPAAAAALCVAAEFLDVGKAVSLQMQFALLVHTDKEAMNRFAGDVEGAIVLLCQAGRQYHGPVEAVVMEQWHRSYGEFRVHCKQLWELFTYFVFLDAKGDRTLLRMVARQMQTMLQMPAAGLVANLGSTGPWAEPTLKGLAQGLVQPLLEQLHAQFLEQWRAALEAAAGAAVESACSSVDMQGQDLQNLRAKMIEELHKQQVQQFWGHYFSKLSQTSWPDFVEAFKDCFCGGSCPQDVLDRLQAHIAKPCKHRVTMASYEALMKRHPRGFPSLLSELIKEVLEDLPSMIYRKPKAKSETEKSVGGTTEVEPEVLRLFGRSRLRKSKTGHAAPCKDEATAYLPQARAPYEIHKSRPKASADEDKMLNSGSGSAPPGVVMVEHRTPSGAPLPVSAGSVTPQDPRMATGVVEPGERIGWEDFLEQVAQFNRPWWAGPGIDFGEEGGDDLEVTPWVQAIHSIKSSLCPTRKALILRVASGNLASGRPLLEVQPKAIFPPPTDKSPRTAWAPSEAPLPGIMITPNDSNFPGVTRAGRGPSEGSRTMMPDLPMSESIASRSHFGIVYNADKDKYQVMDMGSKWGTFKKISPRGQAVSCGDWIRIGNAEIIVRFCGGGCCCDKKHRHYRLHSLSVAQTVCSNAFFRSSRLGLGQATNRGWPQLEDSDDEGEVPMRDQVISITSGVNHLANASGQVWPSTLQRSMSWVDTSRSPKKAGEMTRMNSTSKRAWAEAEDSLGPNVPEGLVMPAAPLEIDFISGPRMGERLMVTDRICTIGRGEKCTIQLSDQTLANVSRTHCIFKCIGNRWWISDNGSTNGTWHRLSCVLQPSEPKDLHTGMTILAGVQELKVEEVEMSRWCIPSTATQVLHEFCMADQIR